MNRDGDSAVNPEKTTVEWFVEVDAAPNDRSASRQLASWLSGDPRRLAAFVRCEAALFLAKKVGSAEQAARGLPKPVRAAGRPAGFTSIGAFAWLRNSSIAWGITAVLFLTTVSVIAHSWWPRTGSGTVGPDTSVPVADGLAAALARPDPAVVLPEQIVVDAGSLAVLPFTIAGNGDARQNDEARAYASVLYRSVLRRLAVIPGIYVVDRESVTPYVGTGMAVGEMAAQLGVRAIAQGRVESSNRRLRVTLRLTDASSGKLMWQSTFERRTGNVGSIGSDMATDVASALAAANPSKRE